MKAVRFILGCFICFVMASFSQCAPAEKLLNTAPLDIQQVYFQKWIAGVEGGGSGLNIFIPVEESAIVLDSVFFRGKGAKLEYQASNPTQYIGRFISDFNKKKDVIISSDPKDEMQNELPKKDPSFPFEINDNQCVVSYKEGGTTKYFKIDGVIEKQGIPYPGAPPIKDN